MKRIALIAGQGKLPLIFAECARKAGERVIGIAINGLASKELEPFVDRLYWGDITQTKKALDILRQEKTDYVVMMGKIPKAIIFDKKVNLNKDAQDLFRNTVDSKDYSIIRAVALRLKMEGIRVLDPTPYFSKLIPEKGLISKRPPAKTEWEDIRFGQKAAKKIAGMDIGQAVAVRRKLILAVEAIEGTDNMIKRAGWLNRDGIVIVKVSRPHQDMRFDIPTIGPKTIDSLIRAQATALAVEAKRTLIVDEDEVAGKADSAGIAVVAI